MEQAREMKPLLALSLLLLCSVLTVSGREKGAPIRDPCTNGMTIEEIFIEERGCSPDQFDYIRDFVRSSGPEITVSFIRDLFTGFCSTAFPAVKQCFLGNIQNCSSDQRHYLSRLADQTGFVCQPNTTQVHPNMLYVLEQMSALPQGDLNQCRQSPARRFRRRCNTEAFGSVGMLRPDGRVDWDRLETLDIQYVVALIQRVWNIKFECIVRKHRDMDMRCQAWRMQAFLNTGESLFPLVLGRTNTFTRSQLAELFEFPQP